MRAIVETGYKGYVAQEFVPTKAQPARFPPRMRRHLRCVINNFRK